MPSEKDPQISKRPDADSGEASKLRKARMVLWSVVGLVALIGITGSLMVRSGGPQRTAEASIGGPFSLIDGNGQSFSSASLSGKPYAIYFGFTRCGDVCPTTLQRLVRLRRAFTSDDAFNIVFVTIDPKNDGPRQVGQYASLFGAPIIGLTGSPAQIDQVKKRYGIFAQPSSHPMPGKEMEHSAIVLLFDRDGRLVDTISPDDPDQAALAKMKQAVA